MKRRLCAAAATVAVLSIVTIAQERIQLATPEPANAQLRVGLFAMTPNNPATAGFDEGALRIEFVGVEQPNARVLCVYDRTTTPTGSTLINGLNVANLSSAYAQNATTGSLIERIHHRLVIGAPNSLGESATNRGICDRPITGTLAGAPQ